MASKPTLLVNPAFDDRGDGSSVRRKQPGRRF
jgi:hypothetical protein